MLDFEEAGRMIADCEKRESKLSEWEAGFIDSIGKQLADNGRLSKKQLDRLEEIWERVT